MSIYHHLLSLPAEVKVNNLLVQIKLHSHLCSGTYCVILSSNITVIKHCLVNKLNRPTWSWPTHSTQRPTNHFLETFQRTPNTHLSAGLSQSLFLSTYIYLVDPAKQVMVLLLFMYSYLGICTINVWDNLLIIWHIHFLNIATWRLLDNLSWFK